MNKNKIINDYKVYKLLFLNISCNYYIIHNIVHNTQIQLRKSLLMEGGHLFSETVFDDQQMYTYYYNFVQFDITEIILKEKNRFSTIS